MPVLTGLPGIICACWHFCRRYRRSAPLRPSQRFNPPRWLSTALFPQGYRFSTRRKGTKFSQRKACGRMRKGGVRERRRAGEHTASSTTFLTWRCHRRRAFSRAVCSRSCALHSTCSRLQPPPPSPLSFLPSGFGIDDRPMKYKSTPALSVRSQFDSSSSLAPRTASHILSADTVRPRSTSCRLTCPYVTEQTHGMLSTLSTLSQQVHAVPTAITRSSTDHSQACGPTSRCICAKRRHTSSHTILPAQTPQAYVQVPTCFAQASSPPPPRVKHIADHRPSPHLPRLHPGRNLHIRHAARTPRLASPPKP